MSRAVTCVSASSLFMPGVWVMVDNWGVVAFTRSVRVEMERSKVCLHDALKLGDTGILFRLAHYLWEADVCDEVWLRETVAVLLEKRRLREQVRKVTLTLREPDQTLVEVFRNFGRAVEEAGKQLGGGWQIGYTQASLGVVKVRAQKPKRKRRKT